MPPTMRMITPSRSSKGKRSDDTQTAPLVSTEDLAAMLASKLEQAKLFEEQAQGSTTSTLLRAFGGSLESRIRDGAKGSTPKEKIKELFREADNNNDGSIQPIELRQLIRNKLKLNVEVKAIDELFAATDTQGLGKLDFAQFSSACQTAIDALDEAKAEARDLEQSAARARSRAEAYEAALTATRLFEEEQDKLDRTSATDVSDPDAGVSELTRKIGAALLKARCTMAELTSRWDEKKVGRMPRSAFIKGVEGLEIGATAVDAERLFDALAAGQGSSGKSDLDMKRLVKTVFEWVSKASEEATAKSSQLSTLRSQARKLQQACDFQRRQSMEMHEAAEQERQLKAAEKAAAKEAARAAKEAKRAAKEAKKAEEKAAFEAKVAARRKEQSAGIGPPVAAPELMA